MTENQLSRSSTCYTKISRRTTHTNSRRFPGFPGVVDTLVNEQILNGTSAQLAYTVPFTSVYAGKYDTEDK